jgi:phosphohistidine swiveling domain-containing protein
MCSGVVQEPARVLLERHANARGGRVLVVKAATLANLPLLVAGHAVVAERGTWLSPAVYALRCLRVPTVVQAPNARALLHDGEVVLVDGSTGWVQRTNHMSSDDGPPLRSFDDGVAIPHPLVTDPMLRPPRMPQVPRASLDDERPVSDEAIESVEDRDAVDSRERDVWDDASDEGATLVDGHGPRRG